MNTPYQTIRHLWIFQFTTLFFGYSNGNAHTILKFGSCLEKGFIHDSTSWKFDTYPNIISKTTS